MRLVAKTRIKVGGTLYPVGHDMTGMLSAADTRLLIDEGVLVAESDQDDPNMLEALDEPVESGGPDPLDYGDGLTRRSVRDLRSIASDLGIPGVTRMSKAKLVDAIREARAEG